MKSMVEVHELVVRGSYCGAFPYIFCVWMKVGCREMENDKEDREEEVGFAQRTFLCGFFVC